MCFDDCMKYMQFSDFAVSGILQYQIIACELSVLKCALSVDSEVGVYFAKLVQFGDSQRR